MSDLITDEIFTDGQSNINAANMNGIIGLARVQPDVIGNKAVSATMNVADQFLVLKTDNTLARAQFSTLVNSTASALTLASTTQNGMLRQVSGNVTDYVGGDNNCHPLSNLLPAGVVVDFAGPNIPAGWLGCQGQSLLRTTYPALFSAIGTTYGAADGTHFSLPNFTNRFSAWIGTLGSTGGASTAALATGNLPSHAHPITDVAHNHSATSTDSGHVHQYTSNLGGGGTWPPGSGWTSRTDTTTTGYAQITTNITASGTGLSTTQAVGSGTAFSILPPYLCVYKMIKT